MDHAPTGEMKFEGEKTGLFISHEDALMYYSALHAVVMGRHDPISHAHVEQLMSLMQEAQDDTIGVVQVLKSFEECRVTAAVLDPILRV
jgi:hypothetical protein